MMCGDQILHADPCPMWPTYGLGEMLLRSHPFEKNSLFQNFAAACCGALWWLVW